MAFNKAILVGNLVADPELKQTPQGTSVCRFRIAVQRRFARSAEQGQPTADFINIVAWRQTAEFVSKYFTKGRPILICGQIQTRNWTDQQGNKRYETEVVADEVSFVDSRSDGGSDRPAAAAQYTPDAYGAPAYGAAPSGDFEEIQGDETLPF